MKQKQVFTIFFSLLFILVFVSNGIAQWTQIGEPINGEQAYDRLGTSLSLSNDGMTLATAAPDASVFQDSISRVKIFKLEGESWIQEGVDLAGDIFMDGFNFPISLSGDGLTLAKGSPFDTINGPTSGSVRVYDVSNEEWDQLGEVILGDQTPFYFGTSISLSDDGRTIAVGTGNQAAFGRVRVYEYNEGIWEQKGDDLVGDLSGDLFGFSVDLSVEGDVLAVGALQSDDFMEGAGEVRVFSWVDDSWVQVGDDITGENAYDASGFSISLDANGETVLVGAPYPDVDEMNDAGYAIVYELLDGSWVQKGQRLNGFGDDYLGYDTSISADGNIISISAPTHRVTPFEPNTGQVKAFYYSNSQWVQHGNILIGPYPTAWFGGSVGLSADGHILAVGSPRNYDVGYESGQVQVYELMPLSVEENDFAESVIIYPNPTRGLVTIQFDNQPASGSISVLNLYGKTLLKQQVNGANSTLDLSALANSIYIIEVRNSESVKVEKLVLDR